MVPLLLLLLLGESLADQVCVNISNHNIQINVIQNVTQTYIDDRFEYMKCEVEGSQCYFECTSSNMMWFNGSNGCVEADVIFQEETIHGRLNQHLYCSLQTCTETIITPLMESLDTSSTYQKEMMRLFNIRNSCTDLFSSNSKVKKFFIEVERRIIHNIMGAAQLGAGGSANYNLKSMSLKVVNVSGAILNSTVDESRIKIEAPQLLLQNASFVPDIWLPVRALRGIQEEKRVIGLVSYMHNSQFQSKQEKISSMVIRIELLEEEPLCNLATSIKMIFRTFPYTDLDNDTFLECQYYDDKDHNWKKDGCETNSSTNDAQFDITCNCDHSTPFAVLLVREDIEEIHWSILSYISYIGCGVSAFFSALALVIYVFSRQHRLDYSISIHVSLSGALFLLNTAFLLNEWGATVTSDWVCVFVAALMHYSLLCSFTWMAIETLHLYLLLIKVFNTYYKHYLVKLSLVGWGIPAVIVTISLAVTNLKQFYGVTHVTMTDTNQTNVICWITDESFFYSVNLVYFGLTFIFNTGVLLAVATSICKMKQVTSSPAEFGAEAKGKAWRDPRRISESCRSGLIVMGLTCLMGTTWGLAFLGSGYVNYPVLYLFCILNSTQGFFIFLWICLSARKQRKKDMEDRMTSTPVKSSGIKSD